jgi:RimJ/RimL family protein N-acetyltransferase
VSIEARIHEENLSSIRVAQKAGFEKSKSLNNQTLANLEATEQGLYILINK